MIKLLILIHDDPTPEQMDGEKGNIIIIQSTILHISAAGCCQKINDGGHRSMFTFLSFSSEYSFT
jgi:hypothetical protein